MARHRSLEALRTRDHGRAAWLPRPDRPSDADLTALLRRLGARLEPPTARRPYWTVWQRGRFLAAARSPRAAILRARHAPC